jgi:histone H3/H4
MQKSEPRIDSTTVRVLAQTAGSSLRGVVRDDVASGLAADADLAVRAVAFMRHAHRDTLHTTDIARALRMRSSDLPPLGYASRGSPPSFAPVPGAPGLFVVPDPVVPLHSVVHAPLPACEPTPRVRASWLVFNGVEHVDEASGEDGAQSTDGRLIRRRPRFRSSVPKRPRSAALLFDAYLQRTTSIIASRNAAPEDLECVFTSLAETPALHPLLPALLSQFHALVASHSNASGCPAVLAAATRAVASMATNPHFGFEAHVAAALPPLLTVIAGRAHPPALRTLAADVLRDIMARHGTPLLRVRAAKTFLAVLTADTSELRAIHGAIVGLTALGRHVVGIALIPYIPALLSGIERVVSAIADVDALSGTTMSFVTSVRTDANNVANAIQVACDEYGSIDRNVASSKVASSLSLLQTA